jgi:hypothetical protein
MKWAELSGSSTESSGPAGVSAVPRETDLDIRRAVESVNAIEVPLYGAGQSVEPKPKWNKEEE